MGEGGCAHHDVVELDDAGVEEEAADEVLEGGTEEDDGLGGAGAHAERDAIPNKRHVVPTPARNLRRETSDVLIPLLSRQHTPASTAP